MKTKLLIISLVLLIMPISGCKFDLKSLNTTTTIQQSVPILIKAEIYFTDGQILNTYVSSLGIDKQSKVFVGGSSINYFYDKQGNIQGAYNYQRVLYIKIAPDNGEQTT